VVAQQSDCSFYIEQDKTQKKVSHSLYPLNFIITESIDVTLNISDKGSPNSIELIFDFSDTSGLPTELGSTLIIKFTDGTSCSIIARTKKINSSIIYFTLVEKGSNSSLTSPSGKNDAFITDKLSKVDIRELMIMADYKQREILIPETKAAIIKNTIQCLTN